MVGQAHGAIVLDAYFVQDVQAHICQRGGIPADALEHRSGRPGGADITDREIDIRPRAHYRGKDDRFPVRVYRGNQPTSPNFARGIFHAGTPSRRNSSDASSENAKLMKSRPRSRA